MRSNSRRTGELLIDHRASPGLPPEWAEQMGLPAADLGEGGILERATLRCNHCGVNVIVNPDRTRPRHYCSGCDHYMCDACAGVAHLTLECHPIAEQLDVIGEALVLGRPAPAFAAPGQTFNPSNLVTGGPLVGT